MGEQVRRENEAEAEKVRQKLALGEECRICYKTIESDPYNAQCGHMFHRQCVQQKFNSGYDYDKKCPGCMKYFQDIQMTGWVSRASSWYQRRYPCQNSPAAVEQQRQSPDAVEQERQLRNSAALRASKH